MFLRFVLIGCEDDRKCLVRIHFKTCLSVIFVLESFIVSMTGLPVVLGEDGMDVTSDQ